MWGSFTSEQSRQSGRKYFGYESAAARVARAFYVSLLFYACAVAHGSACRA